MKIVSTVLFQPRKWLIAFASASLMVIGCGGSGSKATGGTATGTTGSFMQTALVADTPGVAAVTDPHLVNPWGISFSPGGAFWLSDNGTGLSTLYNGSGAIQPLVVTIPPSATGGTTSAPTGTVYNGTSGFVIPGVGQSQFIFDSEDGAITAWYSGNNAVIVNDRSASGAVYKGLAMAANGAATFLYATNFNSGMVDVFDTNFNLVNSFTDPSLPTGYAPYGILNVSGTLYVTFGKQDGPKHDSVSGAGFGYVDTFTPAGTLKAHLVSAGALNAPWGLAIAPSGFGSLGSALLVGNFGDGHINAYNATSGVSMGAMNNAAGNPIAIDGLWSIAFGGGGSAGSASTLYFTAGPNGETHGLFGSLTPG